MYDNPDEQERARFERLFRLADDIINAGFDVFPAAVWKKPDGTVAKAPLTRNGHLDAHRDRQLIRQQLIDPPHVPKSVSEYEVVVAFIPGSGGCGVLDCDVKHGKHGKEALADLVAHYGEFYKAVWTSPSGGANILFDKPPAAHFGNTSPWSGIDVRADNGWVVAPGNACAAGSWTWKLGDFTTAAFLPGAMADQLRAADTHGRKASNAETIEFLDASPNTSSLPSMQAFDAERKRFRQAATGSRHDALLRIVSWTCGMEALDLRWAIELVKDDWQALTAGEGREDEVTDVLTWVVGQEIPKRKAAPTPPLVDYQSSESEVDNLPRPLNWTEFVNRDGTQNQWLVEGFWPWGRAMAVWADAKAGKSELVLWCAAKLALGEHPWTGKPIEPIDIAYFDHEMTEDDLEDRLSDFDIDPLKLEHLHYFLLPAMGPLNYERGGDEMLALVERYGVQAVVIDTFGRAVIGEENSADTVNGYYDYTGKRLKAEGIASLRLDHAGKDQTKQARGSSAKRGDVDVIWALQRTSTGMSLNCASSSRLSWVGPKLVLERRVDPTSGCVSYHTPVLIASVPAGVPQKVLELDKAGVPLDASRRAASAALKAAGFQPGRNEVLNAALRARRDRGQTGTNPTGTTSGTTLGNQPTGTSGDQPDDGTLNLFSDQGKHDGDH